MQDLPNIVNTTLLISANLIVGLLLARFNDLTKKTEKISEKLDRHVEDHGVHWHAASRNQTA